MERSPIGAVGVDRFCNSATLFLAFWTLLANSVVFLAGNLWQLLVGAVASAAVLLTSWILLRGRRAARAGAQFPSEGKTADSAEPENQPPARWRAAVVIGALGCVLLYAFTGRLALYWVGGLALTLLLVGTELRARPIWHRAATTGRHRLALAAMCLGCVALTLVAHRPDADDPFYLNFAVHAVDHPEAPLIAYDTLHGFPELPLSLPVYKVHSIELLEAAVSYLTGLRVLDVAHLLFPVLAALWVVLAYARLSRLLSPTRWIWVLGGALAFLFCIGSPHQSYGNFAFVRLHQGKAVLLSALLPLVIAYGLEFALAPSRRRWLRLAASQIAAVGLSASALWSAPAVAALALASAAPWGRRGARAVLLGLTASAYPLAVAVGLRARTEDLFSLAGTDWGNQASAEAALSNVLGTGAVCWAALFALLGGWAMARHGLLRRVCVVFAAGFLLIFWNPFFAGWIGAHVTGEPTYWRVFWLVPIPLFVALALTAPLELFRRRWLAWWAVALAAVGLFAWAPAAPTWSRTNLVRLGWPHWKVPPVALRAAREIVRLAGPDEVVLAPPSIATWLPTLHDHPVPLVVRQLYLGSLRGRVGPEEIRRREQLAELVSGRSRPARSGDLLASAVEDYRLSLVCLSGIAASWPELRHALSEASLETVVREPTFEIWARRNDEESTRPPIPKR